MVYGKYIYGIISTTSADTEKLRAAGFCFSFFKDIAVLAAEAEIVDISAVPKGNMAKMLVDHQQTIEKVMGLGYSIIPMKLGTFVANESEIIKFLANSYSFIKNCIDKNIDNIEIDIVALWSDFAGTLKEIGEEKEIKEFKAKLMAEPSKVTVERQKQIGMMMASALKKKREYYFKNVNQALSNVSLKSVSHEVMDDQMILNTAFLVNKNELKKFDNKIDELNSEFKDKLHFRYIGPLPCYSFCTFEVRQFDANEIEWAGNKLSLEKATNFKEIKKAYKAKAMSLHPDKNFGKADTNFDDLNNAYKLLTDFCLSVAGTEGGSCSLSEKDVINNNLIVKLKD